MKQLNKLIFFTVLTTVSFSVFSQSDEGLALSLKKLHPDDFHALAYKSEVYEFDIAKNTEKQPVCIVKSNVNERYLSLRNGYSYQVAEFYDKFSTIEKFKVEINSINRMGKPAMRSFTNAIDKSISSEDIFYDDTRVKFFNVSNQDLGEECKSHIEKTYTDSKYLTSIYLQENCPVEEKNVQLIVPLDVEIEIREMNFKGYKIEKTKETKGKKTIYNYVIKRAAAIKNEPHSPGIGYTAPHLVVWVKSFIYDKQNITGFATANDLHKWYKFL